MSDINLLAVLAATVAQFVVGYTWYGPIFGKFWGKIHGFDKLPKAKQKEMMAEMGPWYGAQLLVTILTAFVVVKLSVLFPDYSLYTLVSLIWIGFLVPAQASNAIFGGTETKWMLKKIAVQSFGSLACLLVAVAVVQLF